MYSSGNKFDLLLEGYFWMSRLWQPECKRSHWGLSTWRAQTASWTALHSAPPPAVTDNVRPGPSRILKQQGAWPNNQAVNYLFPCCERGGPWTMQLLSASSAASSQSVTHSCPVQHSKPSKWSGPPVCLSWLSFNQHYCKVEMSPGKDFSVLARAKLTLCIAFPGPRGLSFFPLRSKRTQRAPLPSQLPPTLILWEHPILST